MSTLTRRAGRAMVAIAIAATPWLLLPATALADDSCKWARDGTCDEPTDCRAGTDSSDCAAAQAAAQAAAEAAEQSATQPSSPFELEEPSPSATLGDPLSGIGTLLMLVAAVIWFKRLCGPRSGRIAIGLLAVVMAMVMLPAVLSALPPGALMPLIALHGATGVTPAILLLVLAAGLVMYGFGTRHAAEAAPVSLDGGPRAALSPDVQESDIGEIATARRQCQSVAEQLDAALKAAGGRFHLYAHHDAASTPWLSVDRLSSDARGGFLSSLRMDFVPQPFGTYPVVIHLSINDRGRRRRVSSIVEMGAAQVQLLVTCLMGQGPRFVWKGERLRELGWLQPWRPKQDSTVLEADLIATLRGYFKWGIGLVALFALIQVWMLQPALVTVAVVVSLWAWWRFHVPRPAYRVAGTVPPRPPRMLRQLDSWQVVVRDLGAQREAAVDRLEATLNERLSGSEERIVIRRENIWYQGVDGKVERQQLTLSLRRAMVFVRIYRYGADLFVGWDAHLNLASWQEQEVASGHRESDGVKVKLISVATQYQPVNEYDLTDANFLLEAVHAHLSSLLKELLREREIDQEIDFAIVRESRQAVLGARPESGRRKLFQRA